VRPLDGGNPVGIGGVACASIASRNTTSPFSITMSRAELSAGSRHTTLESNNRVNQIARRRASAARNLIDAYRHIHGYGREGFSWFLKRGQVRTGRRFDHRLLLSRLDAQSL
jgi:exonuclease III